MKTMLGWILAAAVAISLAAGCTSDEGSKDQPAPPAGGAPAPAEAGKAPAAGDYPLAVCVVSGEELGSMGDPFIHSHEGREVRFCCKACLKKFSAEPQKYLAQLDAAGKKK